jgi:glycine oxidase
VSAGDRSATWSDIRADVVVVGGGIVGLATAAALAERDVSVALIAVDRPGAAARAAAGLLVPHYSGEHVRGGVEEFMIAGRDAYPAYVRWVEERSGMRVLFDASGAIELAASPADYAALLGRVPRDAVPLGPADVARLEPALAPVEGGAVLYPRDGAVDNARLTDAIASIVSQHRRVHVVREAAARVDPQRDSVAVVCASGTRVAGLWLVLAAGAWTGRLEGLPRPIPVRPMRGQICTVRGTPLRHVVLGPDVYLVSRIGSRTLVGSTMEDVGFDVGTTPEAIERLRRAAVLLSPALGGAEVLEAWSGLRPVTPDLLPILGADPDHPRLIYACGHSRNGILLAPITAAVTSALIVGEAPGWDLSPFSIARFASAATEANQPGRI